MRSYIESDGYKLGFTIEGQGPTALVIGSATFYARSFSNTLRQHLRLVFVDWRGFVQSPTQEEPEVSIDTLLRDVEHVREELGIDKCFVIGHSAHAILALEYAKKYPNHVSGVVMIAMAPSLSPSHAAQAEQHWHKYASTQRKAALERRITQMPDDRLQALPPSQQFVQWYVRRDPQAWFDFNFDSSMLWEGVVPNMRMFDFLYREYLGAYDVTKGLEKFEKPVFLALGKFDFIVAPASAWDLYRGRFKNLTVRIFERSGHSPQYEESAAFDDELLKWVSGYL